MAALITTLADILANGGELSLSDIDGNELIYIQKGTGSDRDKVIKMVTLIFGMAMVRTSTDDAHPSFLAEKFYGNVTGAVGDVVFTEVEAQGEVKKLKALLNGKCVTSGNLAIDSVTEPAIVEGAVSHRALGNNSVYGENVYNFIVHKNESTSVSSNATKTKVCDFVAISKNGFFDLTVVSNYTGAGNVPSGVTLAVEDADGNELLSWQINGGGAISGTFTKRMIAKQTNNISQPKMLSLFIKNGTISYGWTLGVEVDGIILY